MEFVAMQVVFRDTMLARPQVFVRSGALAIALALGAAQTIDGLVHMFMPDFYSADRETSVGCAANIFYGAGLLGIFSAYQ